jgi:hypothetical protein
MSTVATPPARSPKLRQKARLDQAPLGPPRRDALLDASPDARGRLDRRHALGERGEGGFPLATDGLDLGVGVRDGLEAGACAPAERPERVLGGEAVGEVV